MRQRFIHWRETISHADNSFSVTECLVKGLTQCQRHIFHGVMDVNVQVTFSLDVEVEESVHGEVGQHVVEKSYTSGNIVLTGADQVRSDLYLCFVSLSCYLGVARVISH